MQGAYTKYDVNFVRRVDELYVTSIAALSKKLKHCLLSLCELRGDSELLSGFLWLIIFEPETTR
jgi:hypothetical protein